MRFLFRLIGGVFLLLPFMFASLIYFALEQQPLVKNSVPLNHTDINRAKYIIRNNDPRKLQQGQQKSVTISALDLSVALNYLRSQFIQGGIETSFTGQAININATAIFPNNPIGTYLNLKLTLIPDQKKFAVEQINIGKVSIPPIFIQKVFALYADLKQSQQLAAVKNMLQSAQISQNKLHLSYIWNSNTLNQVKDLIITRQDKKTLLDYQQQLAAITQKYSSKRQYSLTVLLQPLFGYAAQRSVDHNPIQENRALLTVLAAYANGHSLKKLTGSEGAKTKQLRLTLQHRHDFVQHYTISAGLSATGGNVLADAVGLYKEYEDRKGNSGFSFTDLAADRAGVRLGELATASTASARRIQQLMSKHLNESIYMPSTTDLPEGISAKAFKTKYHEGSGSAYQGIVDLIEQRVDKLPIN